jgi:hypothetical protein
MNLRRNLPGQSALRPANLTILPHFSVSAAMSLPKSAGEPGSTVAPKRRTRPNSGDFRLVSCLVEGSCGVRPVPVRAHAGNGPGDTGLTGATAEAEGSRPRRPSLERGRRGWDPRDWRQGRPLSAFGLGRG